SGSRSLEPGLRWSSSTGGPVALPHSDQAMRRPSARVSRWSPSGVVAGIAIIFFPLHLRVSAPLRRVKARRIMDKAEAGLELLPTDASSTRRGLPSRTQLSRHVSGDPAGGAAVAVDLGSDPSQSTCA